jgi:hypothetical protein
MKSFLSDIFCFGLSQEMEANVPPIRKGDEFQNAFISISHGIDFLLERSQWRGRVGVSVLTRPYHL